MLLSRQETSMHIGESSGKKKAPKSGTRREMIQDQKTESSFSRGAVTRKRLVKISGKEKEKDENF